MSINGEHVDMAYLDDKTLYQSPYMVVTDYNYTKHYYIEGQRIISKIGGGFANADIYPLEEIPIAGQFNSYEDFHNGLMEMLLRSFECVGHGTGYYDYDPVLRCMEDLAEADEPEEQIYFYHPDHLGSSAFITDADGEAHQHMQYLPFGETFIDQRIDWNPRFTFTDKEKDKNTGYHYFGARYYDSEVSVWLSVDPMASRYPMVSPFIYTAGNPIIMVDPDGRWVKTRISKEAIKNGAQQKYINMFKEKYGLEVEFKKRLFGYKMQLKEGFEAPDNLKGGAKDWANALDRNKKAKNSFGTVKLQIDYNKSYDGGYFNTRNNTAYVDVGDFNESNILSIDGSEVSALPAEAQDHQFSLRRVNEHEYLYHGIEELPDVIDKGWETTQGTTENTTIGRCNRNAVIESGRSAFIRKNYRAPGANGGVTTIGRYNNNRTNVNIKYRNPASWEPGAQ